MQMSHIHIRFQLYDDKFLVQLRRKTQQHAYGRQAIVGHSATFCFLLSAFAIAMGNVVGSLGRQAVKKARRFNVERRTEKYLESKVKNPPPKPEATLREIAKINQGNGRLSNSFLALYDYMSLCKDKFGIPFGFAQSLLLRIIIHHHVLCVPNVTISQSSKNDMGYKVLNRNLNRWFQKCQT